MVLREDGEEDRGGTGGDVIQGVEGEGPQDEGEDERWEDGGDEAGYEDERLV